jgi:hypothetical protein
MQGEKKYQFVTYSPKVNTDKVLSKAHNLDNGNPKTHNSDLRHGAPALPAHPSQLTPWALPHKRAWSNFPPWKSNYQSTPRQKLDNGQELKVQFIVCWGKLYFSGVIHNQGSLGGTMELNTDGGGFSTNHQLKDVDLRLAGTWAPHSISHPPKGHPSLRVTCGSNLATRQHGAARHNMGLQRHGAIPSYHGTNLVSVPNSFI